MPRLKAVLVAALAFAALLTVQAAAAGKSSAHAIVRLLNSRASGSPAEYEAAAQILAEECKELRPDGSPAHPLQRYVLALVSGDHDAPSCVRMDPETRAAYLDSSRDRLMKLAERKNNPLAWYLLSLERNDMGYLKRAVDAGNVQALNAWGTVRLMRTFADPSLTTNEVQEVLSDCFDCFRRAAEQDDVNGIYNVGMCRMNGYGCKRDVRAAFDCFRKAAEVGHPEAINNLGGFYRDGLVVTRDAKRAVELFQKSAEYGNHYGELNFALALQRGDGVGKDEIRAAGLLKKAAEGGNAEAMNVYGMCFFNGTGVAPNPAVAFAWFSRSASEGFPPAMDNLSVCYDRGSGVPKSHEMSLVWKIRARANSGDARAADWLKNNGYSLR